MMSYYGLDSHTIKKIQTYNEIIRTRLLNRANNFSTEEERAQFVVDYFTNNLSRDVIADIDDVPEKRAVDFSYDYSFLEGNETPFPRRQERIYYPGGSGITLTPADRDFNVDGAPRIYPTVFALKKGTCIIFANELKRLMANLGIKCEIVEPPIGVDCYDKFDGTDVEFNPIHTNDIKKMHHYYNVIEIDGKKYKIDIAGYLTAQDFNKYKPEKYKETIDVSRFCMTEDLDSNPFEEIKARSISD